MATVRSSRVSRARRRRPCPPAEQSLDHVRTQPVARGRRSGLDDLAQRGGRRDQIEHLAPQLGARAVIDHELRAVLDRETGRFSQQRFRQLPRGCVHGLAFPAAT